LATTSPASHHQASAVVVVILSCGRLFLSSPASASSPTVLHPLLLFLSAATCSCSAYSASRHQQTRNFLAPPNPRAGPHKLTPDQFTHGRKWTQDLRITFVATQLSRCSRGTILTDKCSNHRRNLVPTLKHTSRTVRRSLAALSQEPVRLIQIKVACSKSAMPESFALPMSEVRTFQFHLHLNAVSDSQFDR
jgi:hypothetical protein